MNTKDASKKLFHVFRQHDQFERIQLAWERSFYRYPTPNFNNRARKNEEYSDLVLEWLNFILRNDVTLSPQLKGLDDIISSPTDELKSHINLLSPNLDEVAAQKIKLNIESINKADRDRQIEAIKSRKTKELIDELGVSIDELEIEKPTDRAKLIVGNEQELNNESLILKYLLEKSNHIIPVGGWGMNDEISQAISNEVFERKKEDAKSFRKLAYQKIIFYEKDHREGFFRLTWSSYVEEDYRVYNWNNRLTRQIAESYSGDFIEFDNTTYNIKAVYILDYDRKSNTFVKARYKKQGDDKVFEYEIGSKLDSADVLTKEQTKVLNTVEENEFIVTGIAGSGKTIVAINKMAEYRLRKKEAGQYHIKGVGFVLNQTLVTHLKNALNEKYLHDLPINVYFDERKKWSAQFGIRPEDISADNASFTAKKAWINYIHREMFNIIISKKLLPKVRQRYSSKIGKANSKEKKRLGKEKEVAVVEAVNLGLTYKNEKLSRKIELCLIHIDNSNLLSGINIMLSQNELIDYYKEIISKISLDSQILKDAKLKKDEIKKSIKRFETSILTYDDIDVIYNIHQSITRLKKIIDRSNKRTSELIYSGSPVVEYNYLFVDEFQDFTHLQLEILKNSVEEGGFFMMVGDTYQRLSGEGIKNHDVTSTLHLSVNKRQEYYLERFSSAYRQTIQGDDREITPGYEESGLRPRRFDNIFPLIAECWADPDYKNGNIAVVCPNITTVKEVYEELSSNDQYVVVNALEQEHFEIEHSIYVSNPPSLKGLQFDIVFILDIHKYKTTSRIERNELYVALSRPRKQIFLSWDNNKLSYEFNELLEQHVLDLNRPLTMDVQSDESSMSLVSEIHRLENRIQGLETKIDRILEILSQR